MPRGIDHLVLCTEDLNDAEAMFVRLGLTTTPIAHHPFGTGNIIVQLDGCFLEILGVTRPELIPDDAVGAFNFGAFNRDFIARGPGMSMLVLASDDENADRADFEAKGLRTYAPFSFERKAMQPDGTEATIGFSLTFSTDDSMPGLAFFTCKHWRPDLFWKPGYQKHDIGATGIAEVLVVAPEPTKPADYLAKLADAAPAGPNNSVEAAGTRFTVLTPTAFADRFPEHGMERKGDAPFFAGFILEGEPVTASVHWHKHGLTVHGTPEAPWLGGETELGYIIGVV